MNYKVIIFKCGCKYIWLNGTERRYKVCPEHKRPTGSYITWCKRCGKKVTDKPQAGYRRIYCVDCYPEIQNERSKKWAAANPGYWRKKDKELTRPEQVEPKLPEKVIAEKAINAWYQAMREMFKPVWEGVG